MVSRPGNPGGGDPELFSSTVCGATGIRDNSAQGYKHASNNNNYVVVAADIKSTPLTPILLLKFIIFAYKLP